MASGVGCTNSRTSLERDVCERRQDTDTVQLQAKRGSCGWMGGDSKVKWRMVRAVDTGALLLWR